MGGLVKIVLPVAGHALPGIKRQEPTVSDMLQTRPNIVASELEEEDEFEVAQATTLGGLKPIQSGEMPPLPKESQLSSEKPMESPLSKSSEEQAKDLLDDLINMQVKVRNPKVK
ncbi:MAG: hypothetical protein R2827_16515 [Bdellovibrionales bacterium]